MRRNKYKSLIIMFVFIALFIMTTGYSIYQKRLSIGGVSRIDYKNWNIHISNIEMIETDGGVDVIAPSYTNTTAKFNSRITKPGGYIKYKITIKNDGIIDGVLGAINITDTENSVISYVVTGMELDDGLRAHQSKDIYVKAVYDSSKIDTATTNKSNVSVNLTFMQLDGYTLQNYHSITYRNMENTESLASRIYHNDSLSIDLTGFDVRDVKVYMDNMLITNYTFSNNILTIPNVTGNLIIMKNNFNYAGVTDGLLLYADYNNSSSSKWGDFSANRDSFSSSSNLTYENIGLKMTSSSPILKYDFDASMDISGEYSIMVTVDGDIMQEGQPNRNFAGMIISVSEAVGNYVNYIGYYKGYLNVASYYNKAPYSGTDYIFNETGFSSISLDGYNNKKLNIIVTAKLGGKTQVYFNGNLVSEFDSGTPILHYSYITMGDLRPGRGLKFTGTVYDSALYNRALTAAEVAQNWAVENGKYNIE